MGMIDLIYGNVKRELERIERERLLPRATPVPLVPTSKEQDSRLIDRITRKR